MRDGRQRDEEIERRDFFFFFSFFLCFFVRTAGEREKHQVSIQRNLKIRVWVGIRGKADDIGCMRQIRASGGSRQCRVCEGARCPVGSRCARMRASAS